MDTKIITKDYWQKRHKKTDLATVGYIGLGMPFNYWMYKIREKVFSDIVKKEHLNLKSMKILDVGSGSGFYIKLWQDLGTKDITASDFSSKALAQIRKNHPKTKTLLLDITQPIPQKYLAKYDIVSAFDIFYHIVDNKKYNQAIKNIHKLLKPNGIFIFSENLTPKTQRAKYQVSRSKKTVFSILRKSHFETKLIRSIFFSMNAPLCSENRFLKLYWFVLVNTLIKLNFLGYLLGPLLYPFELMLALGNRKGPSTKIVIVKKTK